MCMCVCVCVCMVRPDGTLSQLRQRAEAAGLGATPPPRPRLFTPGHYICTLVRGGRLLMARDWPQRRSTPLLSLARTMLERQSWLGQPAMRQARYLGRTCRTSTGSCRYNVVVAPVFSGDGCALAACQAVQESIPSVESYDYVVSGDALERQNF